MRKPGEQELAHPNSKSLSALFETRLLSREKTDADGKYSRAACDIPALQLRPKEKTDKTERRRFYLLRETACEEVTSGIQSR